MNLTINSNNELLDESGSVIGPIFDSIANGVASIPDVQRAFEARMAEMQSAFEKAAAQAKSDAEKASKEASDKAASELIAAKETSAKELAKAKADFDDALQKLSADVDKEIEGLNANLAASETMANGLAAKLDAANKQGEAFKSGLAQLGNAQRSCIEDLQENSYEFYRVLTDKLAIIASFNNRALADDDARRKTAELADIAAQEAAIAERKAKLGA